MSKFGINVPPGVPAFSQDDVKRAAEKMKDENNEVWDCIIQQLERMLQTAEIKV